MSRVEPIDFLKAQSAKDGVGKTVVGAVIINQAAEALFLKRKADDFMGGLLEIPSGNLESGEELLHGLAREVREETGLDIKEVSGLINFFDYRSQSGKKVRQFNFAVVCDLSRDIVLSEHDEHCWLGYEQICSHCRISAEVKSALSIAYFNLRKA